MGPRLEYILREYHCKALLEYQDPLLASGRQIVSGKSRGKVTDGGEELLGGWFPNGMITCPAGHLSDSEQGRTISFRAL